MARHALILALATTQAARAVPRLQGVFLSLTSTNADYTRARGVGGERRYDRDAAPPAGKTPGPENSPP